MNMHGIIQPDFAGSATKESRVGRVIQWLKSRYMLLIVVVAPVTLTAGYFFGFASNQYASEAHFLVRSTQSAAAPVAAGGLSQILSLAGGMSSAQSEAMSVADYLSSHDAVAALEKDDRLVERYSLPSADFFSRLRTSALTPEKLLKYYRNMVTVDYNSETGITTLSVRSFRPVDSYQLVQKMLKLGEARVNELNRRSYSDSIALARQQLAEAETALTANQAQMMHFRQSRSDIDPNATGQDRKSVV